jgi:hypothetical protein
MRTPPPTKKAGQAKGPRSLNGEVLDVAAVAALLGATVKTVRARAARGLLPCRRWGSRLIFLHAEVLAFLGQLEGTSVQEALQNVATRREAE